jgi:hypothetical protein
MNFTGRYVIESKNDTYNPFIIEFTDEQDIQDTDTDQYIGADAYECYILDDENEPIIRAVYYYESYTGRKYLGYYEEEDKFIMIKIRRILKIEDGDTIEEVIDKADEAEGLTMGDIC